MSSILEKNGPAMYGLGKSHFKQAKIQTSFQEDFEKYLFRSIYKWIYLLIYLFIIFFFCKISWPESATYKNFHAI